MSPQDTWRCAWAATPRDSWYAPPT
ncbi:hypothetical protein Ahy_A07g034632 isoform B [Arachis hypogaea]|uniref:Uncharacterized protein n=1 Tax=Arachis hypogaea TaxID=3818 RepID=A0A445CCC0_ARAHY|nr:hypothetical protein Ahy_A07g034632 isoform B [Arachis hypogaea]